MNKAVRFLDARKPEERVLLLAMAVLVTGLAWMTLAHDRFSAERGDLERRITISNSQILEETNRQAEIRSTFSTDPNAFAFTRRQELQQATARVDQRLDQLYGELISPRQMSLVLTSILQRETSLELISLENLQPESLVDAAVPTSTGGSNNVRIFRHGLRMVFEGDFLETVRYLRSLEQLDSNFFWEGLEFEVLEYPRASISLDIYTLSTQRGWIGV